MSTLMCVFISTALGTENLEYIEYENAVSSFFEDPIAEEESENRNLDCTEPDKKIQYYPIVYTTRLEDMHIFKKKFDVISLESVVKSVVAARKPELTSDSLIKKENFNDLTFYDLVDKLEHFNTLVNQGKYKKVVSEEKHIDLITTILKTEPEDSNSDLLEAKIKELCKPLSVALVDCKHLLKLDKLCRKHKKYPLGDEVLSCIKCVKVLRVGNDVKVLKNDPPRDDDVLVQDVNIETSSEYVTAANFSLPQSRVAGASRASRKRKFQNNNSGASLEGNIKQQVTDIQISNVHSQVTMGNLASNSGYFQNTYKTT